MKKIIVGLSRDELKDIIENKLSDRSYRVNQIIYWIYKKSVNSFDRMSNLPIEFRKKLDELFSFEVYKSFTKNISKIDNTTRYNFLTHDEHLVYAVYIPKMNRNVVCISTQIGCSIGCRFCNSGRVKFKRNLTVSEIVEEVLQIQRDVGRINNILFMGMGEPLLNYDNLISSIKIFASEDYFSISRHKITISSVGVVPMIYKLLDDKIEVNLAISLHSSNDKKRNDIVKNLNFSVDEIIKAASEYAKTTQTKLTIEYVLIKNFNDSVKDANGLVKLLSRYIKNRNLLKINLIPFNFVINEWNYETPPKENIEIFKQILIKKGYMTFIRKPHGVDIFAGCGQLGY